MESNCLIFVKFCINIAGRVSIVITVFGLEREENDNWLRPVREKGNMITIRMGKTK